MLLHVLAVASIAAATLYLLARAVLAHVGAADYFTAYNYRWFGARSAGATPFLWVGPLVVGRHPGGGFEWLCSRFSGELGPARIVGIAFAGISLNMDIHDRTGRALIVAPWVLFAAWFAAQPFTSAREYPDTWYALAGLACINLFIASLLWTGDVLRTALHYATLDTRSADGEAHEAYERGRNDGTRYAEQRQRFTEGHRYDAPPFPANPYAA